MAGQGIVSERLDERHVIARENGERILARPERSWVNVSGAEMARRRLGCQMLKRIVARMSRPASGAKSFKKLA
jgi:hypothetical protein